MSTVTADPNAAGAANAAPADAGGATNLVNEPGSGDPAAAGGDQAALDAAAGNTLESVKTTPLGASEGPLKNLKTVGDLATAYEEVTREHGKTSTELKRANEQLAKLSPEGQQAAQLHTRGQEMWDTAVGEINESGNVSKDTLGSLEKMTGLPQSVWQRVVGAYLQSDKQLSEQTQKALGVDSKGFQELIEKANVSDAYREFIEDQVLAGRYGFLTDLAADFKSRGLVTTEPNPMQTQQPQANEPHPQVNMGEPPAPASAGLQPWASEAAFQQEFNAAEIAVKQGNDEGKMDALKARMAKLEAAGVPFYGGAPEKFTVE